MAIFYGTNNIGKVYFGNLEVSKIYLGQVEIYSAEEQLAAPTLSLEGDTLTITDNSEMAESFDIYVDGVLEANVPTTSGYTVNIVRGRYYETDSEIKVNNGESQTVLETDFPIVLSDVAKLEVYMTGNDATEIAIGTTSGGTDSADLWNTAFDWTDITQYLQDGCYIALNNED